jgi:hypothetical protein
MNLIGKAKQTDVPAQMNIYSSAVTSLSCENAKLIKQASLGEMFSLIDTRIGARVCTCMPFYLKSIGYSQSRGFSRGQSERISTSRISILSHTIAGHFRCRDRCRRHDGITSRSGAAITLIPFRLLSLRLNCALRTRCITLHTIAIKFSLGDKSGYVATAMSRAAIRIQRFASCRETFPKRHHR